MSRERRRLYRDRENAVIAGVCSGIADHYGFDLGLVRAAFIVGCVFAAPFTISAYVVMAFVIPVRPGQEDVEPKWRREHKERKRKRGHKPEPPPGLGPLPGMEPEPEPEPEEDTDWKRFDQGVNRAPKDVFQGVRHSFRELESRLQRMERYVTSRHYDLDAEFRDLET